MERAKMPVDGKCGYCGTEIKSCAAGDFCPNRECGYIDGYYRPIAPKRPTYADLRKTDPTIRAIILYIISRNVQQPEIAAIEKILWEGADGRYLAETV